MSATSNKEAGAESLLGINNPFESPELYLDKIKNSKYRLPTLTTSVSRLTIEITKYCSINCSFCKYNAPLPGKKEKNQRFFLSDQVVSKIIRYINSSSTNAVVLTGGGEPTHEMKNIIRIIKETNIPLYSIYTAGQWATTEGSIQDMFVQLQSALDHSLNSNARIRLRLSMDTFHEEKLGITPILLIINFYRQHRIRYNKIDISIRTILDYDAPIDKLASVLDCKLTCVDRHKAILVFPDDLAIEIIYANLIPVGRFTTTNSVSYKLSPLRQTLSGLRNVFGEGWPVLYENGLNIGIRPSGRPYIYGGSPESFGTLLDKDLDEIIEEIAMDPITLALLKEGILEFFDIISLCNKSIAESRETHEEPSLLIPIACGSQHNLLLVKLAALVVLCDHFSIAKTILSNIGLSYLVDGTRQARLTKLGNLYGDRQMKTTQKIGNITGSQNIDITQSANTESQQEIGNILHATDIRILQHAAKENDLNLRSIQFEMEGLNHHEKSDLIKEINSIISEETEQKEVSIATLVKANDECIVNKPHLVDTNYIIQNSATTASLVSGSIAIATLTDPYILGLAVPATLFTMGFLHKEQLSHIYAKIKKAIMSLRDSRNE